MTKISSNFVIVMSCCAFDAHISVYEFHNTL